MASSTEEKKSSNSGSSSSISSSGSGSSSSSRVVWLRPDLVPSTSELGFVKEGPVPLPDVARDDWFPPSATSKDEKEESKRSRKMKDKSAPARILTRESESTTWDTRVTRHHLINALLYAYNHHVPFALNPHHIQMQINLNVASYVTANAEKLRSTLVSHKGKEKLEVRLGPRSGPLSRTDWHYVVHEFCTKIEEKTKTPLASQLATNYSTSTSVSMAASRITVMSTMQSYFDYSVSCLCGIPAIYVHGTPEDWNTLGKNYEAIKSILPEFHWWSKMDEIMKRLLETALTTGGKASPAVVDFWSRIVSKEVVYGSGAGTYFSGWMMDLFAYSRDMAPRVDVDTPKLVDVPDSMVGTPATIRGGRTTDVLVRLEAGFVGVRLPEPDCPAVAPVMGYTILQMD